MGNCLKGAFYENIPKYSLDTLLLNQNLSDTHEYASLLDTDAEFIDQTTINLNLLERIKNLEENVQALSSDIHTINENYISNHQSSSK